MICIHMKNLCLTATVIFSCFCTAAQQSINIAGPAGSGNFGNLVTVLPNGNYVVTDPGFDEGGVTDIGAVYLYNGLTHQIISTLKGSRSSDQVGQNGITILSNGHYVIRSSNWDNGTVSNAGAVTWCSSSTGLNGVVSSSNSLVGGTTSDRIGNSPIITLSNGNYVVVSINWDNGTATDAGAVTLCNGSTGTSGVVSSSNSLVGDKSNDRVGDGGITLLSNSNYVVRSSSWANNTASGAGAVTWCSGTTARTGVVSSTNSLVGSTAEDNIGDNGIIVLSNGNYVVISTVWDNGTAIDAGAATWCSGTAGKSGAISSANSLVGTKSNDLVGIGGITQLSNNNYVVNSYSWNSSSTVLAVGAVTWCDGTAGRNAAVSSSNSLVGTLANDAVGGYGIIALSSGNYVVISSEWDLSSTVTNVGAVTWCSGTIGRSGTISSTNSLVGSSTNDQIGNFGIVRLSNGNYVVISPDWNSGTIVDAGAVTWCSGTTARTGTVSASNSLVGSTANDFVGLGGVVALSNGNYVVVSNLWNNGSVAADVGAVTWCSGTDGRTGTISSTNSLVGSTALDEIGNRGITELSNGNYVVISTLWDNGLATNAGAVTWCSGTAGRTGTISSTNSLVGSTSNDRIGFDEVFALGNGNYVVRSSFWSNGAITGAGAVTWGNGSTGTTGVISSSNSLVGSTANDNVGSQSIIAVGNANYLVRSPNWANGTVLNAGAVTWCSGSSATTGAVSSANSFVGNNSSDAVSEIYTLSNGNYVVRTLNWDNGPVSNVGAVTWCSGNSGCTGTINSSNSLVGSTANDLIGSNSIITLADGNYIVWSGAWDGGNTNTGAVTLGNGTTGTTGVINSCNSVLGTGLNQGANVVPVYNANQGYMIAGLRLENRLVIFNPQGQSIANNLDMATTSISGSSTVRLVTSSFCRTIGTITPNGANPVSGTVTARLWIQSTVPIVNSQPFVARHYEITPATNPTTATARVTLYFTQQEFTDFNNHPGSTLDLPTGPTDAAGIANLRMRKYDGSSNNGTGLPASYTGGSMIIDPDDNNIVWNAPLNRWEVSFDVTGFSGFIVQTISSTLPLRWLAFNGYLQNSNAVLNWKTESEINTDKFIVERSTDARVFNAIGVVKSNGLAGENAYTFTDIGAATGTKILYYRLRQTDNDGRFSFSHTIALAVRSNSTLQVYPNPVVNKLTLTMVTETATALQIRIIDFNGRIVQQLTQQVPAGNSNLQLNVSSLPKGLYRMEVTGGSIEAQHNFIKQ